MRNLALLFISLALVEAAAQQPPPPAGDVPYRAGQYDAITDVPGVKVGHYTHTQGAMRGITAVIMGERGGSCGVEVRGGNPGTMADSTYTPVNIGEECDAVVLTGGSLWGFATVPGVMEYLFSQGKGVPTRGGSLPVVPAAVIFDLPIGDAKIHPKFEWGWKAAESAKSGPVEQGNVGAGTGGTIGKLTHGVQMKGGLGTASAVLPDGTVVGVIVVLNAVGDVVNPKTGELYATAGFADVEYRHRHTIPPRKTEFRSGENTTLAIVATNAKLDKVQLTKIAQMAHNGLARAIRPIHSMWDGDTIFAVSVGWDDRVEPDVAFPAEAVDRIGAVAADLLVRAIVKGVNAAEGIPGWPSYRDWKEARGEKP